MCADLTKTRLDIKDEVACPLCLNRFRSDAIDDERLSVEHVIPSALGGNVVTLTCTLCNNTHGSELDRNLVSAMKAVDWLEGHNVALPSVLHNEHGHVAANEAGMARRLHRYGVGTG
jgi:5-methylcytosine-specific restriction endonuclease McrA